MAKYITFFITLVICLLIAAPSQAVMKGEDLTLFEQAQNYIADNADRIEVSADGLSYGMEGQTSNEEGFHFFLSPTTGGDRYDGMTPEQLNNIEPSAGLRFTISFD